MSVALFWICAGLLAYTYAGFPLLLALRARWFPRPHLTGDAAPSVSLIIAAYNEAASIEAKLNSALALDYPRQRLEIIVASDGSTDGTEEIVGRYADRGVQLLALPRRGKAAALNDAAQAASGEVLIFSDANSILDPRAVRALVSPLADSHVGGVAGDQRYLSGDAPSSAEGERRYWDFDRLMKRWQSAAGNVTSATGSLYAIRRALFTAVPEGVTDDFAVSTAVIAQGRRLVFAEDAVAYEPPAAAAPDELARKTRIMTRGFRGVLVRRTLLIPWRHGFYSVQLFSHKVLRRLMAIPLLALLVASPWLIQAGALYQAAVACQLAFYGLAALGWSLAGMRFGRCKAMSFPYFFCLVNAAALWAVANVALGRKIVTWNPKRPAAALDAVPNAS